VNRFDQTQKDDFSVGVGVNISFGISRKVVVSPLPLCMDHLFRLGWIELSLTAFSDMSVSDAPQNPIDI
jgi:hypothetical protein